MSDFGAIASDERLGTDQGRAIARLLFVVGMLLMPISTGAIRGVFAFGLPFLGLLSVHYLMLQVAHPYMDRWHRRIGLYAFLLVAAIAITTMYSIAPFASFARLMPNVLGFFLFMILISPFFGDQSSYATYELTGRVYAFAGGLVAAYYLANFVYAVSTIGLAAVFLDRVTGGIISLPWGATNVVASVLLFPFSLTFYFASREVSGAGRWKYLVLRILMVAAIATTVSRGAIISLGFGLCVLAVLLRGRRQIRVILLLIAAAAVVVYVNKQINDVMSQQVVSTLVNRFQDSDVRDMNGRIFLWEKFGAAFVESPVFGIGYYSSLYYFQMSGHNLFLTSLVERGLLGFALSAALPIKAGETLLHGLAAAPDARTRLFFCCLTAGALSSMLHLMIEDANFTQQYIVYSWVALALVFQAAQVIRSKGNRPIKAPVVLPLSFQT